MAYTGGRVWSADLGEFEESLLRAVAGGRALPYEALGRQTGLHGTVLARELGRLEHRGYVNVRPSMGISPVLVALAPAGKLWLVDHPAGPAL